MRRCGAQGGRDQNGPLQVLRGKSFGRERGVGNA